ncbi:response regulator [Paenibacillus aurantiacus]|uniref:Response regulator n=1 Tax=Paenibacillus aurantiacus TaxID=1936118 RepID=A0ABV5KVA5_9BACL
MNIIIVDDEEFIRLGLAKIMSRMSLPINVVGSHANGRDALTHVLDLAPDALDLLITDIKMPMMDGLKLIEQVRESRRDLPIAVLSGYGEFEYARLAMRMGVKDYLLKPVDTAQLHELLNSVYQGTVAESKLLDAEETLGEGEERDHYAVEELKRILNAEYNKNFELEQLAKAVGMSASYISRLFRGKTGLTLTDYVIGLRMEKAKQFLTDHPHLRNYEISQLVGYYDPVYFNKLFKRTFGMTPKEYKEKHHS